ncbi:Protein boule-like [Trichinella murrelli]|uniref:Protein boule-like n=1 Tax=Trichinella murrelli TaxID=144512 RepID=A0A0V0U9R2_9BILA|nr:Protein boule-like [Trichinella murrelli]
MWFVHSTKSTEAEICFTLDNSTGDFTDDCLFKISAFCTIPPMPYNPTQLFESCKGYHGPPPMAARYYSACHCSVWIGQPALCAARPELIIHITARYSILLLLKMSNFAPNSPDSGRDTSSHSPAVTTVSTPRVGTLIPNRIFVGGFPPATVEHDLRAFFDKCGTVKDVKIIRDQTGISKGYGFVTFETDEEAKSLIEKAEPFEFKGRHLNIGAAVRKSSNQFKTYDIVPQGAVLCSYGMPYALQNGITLLASPDAYAVAQPIQHSVQYPFVFPHGLQPMLYPSVPIGTANNQTSNATQITIASPHAANQQQTQHCVAQQVQQSNSNQGSPSKKTPAPLQLQPNMVSLNNVVNTLPANLGNLTLGTQINPQAQYRFAAPAVAPPLTHYIYPNSVAYQNVVQEIPSYPATIPANAYVHQEFTEIMQKQIAPTVIGVLIPLEQQCDQCTVNTTENNCCTVNHSADCIPENSCCEDWQDNAVDFAELRSLIPRNCFSLPCSPAIKNSLEGIISNLHGKTIEGGRNARYGSPRKQTTYTNHGNVISSGSPRFSNTTPPKSGYRYTGKSGGNGYHKMVTCAGCEYDPNKADVKQPPGSVVTPPPTPIAPEYK